MASAPARRSVRAVCPHDCPDTCSMLGGGEDGRAVTIGFGPPPASPAPFLCAKVTQYLDRVYSPERTLHPLRRVGRKGEGRFERVSWDEALDLVADGLRRTSERWGAQAILPYSYAGNMGVLSYGSLD